MRAPDRARVALVALVATLAVLAPMPSSGSVSTTSPGDEDTETDVRLAAEDLERGTAVFFKGKGTQRFKEAAAFFTAVMDRLSPRAASLGPEGRRILARALDYRAQTSLLQGQDKSADVDFRLLVETDPAYEPDPGATSRKILDRFRKVRTSLIAAVTIEASPPEAVIVWNGRSLGPASGLPRPLTVLAGPFVLLARHDCFEDTQIEGRIDPGETRTVKVRIDPSARPVRFETVPEGFDVELDGTLVGQTGPLVVPCIPAGDHAYTLRRDCFKTVTGNVSVIVDFVDRDPLVVRVVAERRVSRLSVESDVPGSQVTLEGELLGAAPVKGKEVCPGTGCVEVRSGDRVVWSDRVELVEGDVRVRAEARPLLRSTVLESSPGGRLSPMAAARIRERISRLASFNHAALTSPEQLREIDREEARLAGTEPRRLDVGADLVLVVDGSASARGDLVRLRLAAGLGGFLRTHVCGANDEKCVDRFFSGLEAPWPSWGGRAGMGLVDTLDAKGARIVSVEEAARSAGVKDGDVLVSAGGQPVTGAVSFRRLLYEALEGDTANRTLPVVLQRAGSRVEASIPIRRAPIVPPPSSEPVSVPRMVAAADLDVSVLPPGERRNAALLTLASLLMGTGEPARALALALDRPDWADDVPGAASVGTARFLAGLCHETLGDRVHAAADFTKAASAQGAELWTPDGLPVAPLARTKLKALSRP